MKKEELTERLKGNLGKEGVSIINTPVSKDKKSTWSFQIKVQDEKEKTIRETLYKIFRPNITESEWNELFTMAIGGDGNELRRITTLHSSSLLSLLIFCGISEKNSVTICGTTYNKVYFEVKNNVFKNAERTDKPSNVDIMLVSEDRTKVMFLESKFTEYSHDGKVEISEKYDKFYSELMECIPELNLKFGNGYLELKKGRNSQYLAGIKQMFSHLIGILTEPSEECHEEAKEFIRNANEIKLGSIVYNWDEGLYKKYSEFYNSVFRHSSLILKKCFNNSEINAEKIDIVSILPNLLSYQELLKKNPDYQISEPIKSFYALEN